MDTPQKKMILSPLWLQVSILTFLIGFAVLGYLAIRTVKEHPPIPREVQSSTGVTLFTEGDVFAGQDLFQKYGLMQYGTLFGHGAYLGPDFTAQYLHLSGEKMAGYL